MCPDSVFDEETSPLVTGPIHRERWIYSASKQLLDRVIYAYGKHENLSWTLFRPFNWFGPRLDNISNPKPGSSRVLTQFIGNILRGEDILLVNGGSQCRAFMYIGDGINALLKMIENKNQCAHQQIFNIGNPAENYSIRELAEMLLAKISCWPEYAEIARHVSLVSVEAKEYYGEGYEDVSCRVPRVEKARMMLD